MRIGALLSVECFWSALANLLCSNPVWRLRLLDPKTALTHARDRAVPGSLALSVSFNNQSLVLLEEFRYHWGAQVLLRNFRFLYGVVCCLSMRNGDLYMFRRVFELLSCTLIDCFWCCFQGLQLGPKCPLSHVESVQQLSKHA